MRTIVKGKNFDVPDTVRAYTERKLARLERILDDRSDALVELSVEQHRSADDSHIVEVTLVIDGRTLRTHAAAVSHRAGVDEVVDKLERRAVDHREKPRHRSRPPEEKEVNMRLALLHPDVAALRRYLVDGRWMTREAGIYRRSKPMAPEAADSAEDSAG